MASSLLSRRASTPEQLISRAKETISVSTLTLNVNGKNLPVTSWLTVGTDERIILTIGSSNMGQGSFDGLAQILAEDLMVDYDRIEAVQGGPTIASPAPVGTAINTVGSGVTRSNFWRMRDAAAAAREMLVQAAMNRLGDAARTSYTVTDGVIAHVGGRRPRARRGGRRQRQRGRGGR